MKILVTGGAGFIGSHLVDKLTDLGHKVVILDNLSTGRQENINKKAKFYKIDILSPALFKIFGKEKPQVVYHFAAQINVRKSIEDPLNDAKTNILGSLNILENCRRFKVKKIIFASTAGAIYGETRKIPTPENYSPEPISPYGIAKLTVENYLRFYKKNFGLDFISLRFGNVYGPRQDPEGEAGVIAIFINKFLKGERPIIFGDGNQTRDFIFVKDVVEASVRVLHYRSLNVDDLILNVATGKETSINQLYTMLKEDLNSKIKPIYTQTIKGDVKRSCLDISKIKKKLKWLPKYNLIEGLRETISYFKKKIN